ncbi:MAG: hypothetical protein QXZ51_00255 [Candidatus Bathyarchaeia archaeon]
MRYWVWNSKAQKWVPRNSLYDNAFRCSHCCQKIPKTAAKTDHKGTLRCPQCHKPLRTKPRMYGKRKPKTSTLTENANPIHSPAAAELQNSIVAESIIKPSKQQLSEKPCNNNIGSMQNMGVWKK